MHMLYEEDNRAFQRLQEDIIKVTNDRTLFLWRNPSTDPLTMSGLFAQSPSAFARPSQMIYANDDVESFHMTNRGLKIDAHLLRAGIDLYIMVFDSFLTRTGEWCGLVLRAIDSRRNDFARVNAGQLVALSVRPETTCTIYIWPRKQVVIDSFGSPSKVARLPALLYAECSLPTCSMLNPYLSVSDLSDRSLHTNSGAERLIVARPVYLFDSNEEHTEWTLVVWTVRWPTNVENTKTVVFTCLQHDHDKIWIQLSLLGTASGGDGYLIIKDDATKFYHESWNATTGPSA